jgi:hypothetical protein
MKKFALPFKINRSIEISLQQQGSRQSLGDTEKALSHQFHDELN